MKNLAYIILVLVLFSSCHEKKLESIENKLDELNSIISQSESEELTESEVLTIAEVCQKMGLKEEDIVYERGKIQTSRIINTDLDSIEIKSSCFYIKNDTSAFYIMFDVLNKDREHVHAKFIPVPHHTLEVIDDPQKDKFKGIVGFLEVLDKKKNFKKHKHFRYPDLHKGTLVACVDIPKNNSRKTQYNLLVVPPQSEKHNVDHPQELHTSRHPVDDPRP